jgi:5'-methylthioadenosine/S-adenosylhomocysteine nucleosidase
MILILGNSSDSLIYLKNMLRYSEDRDELSGALTSHLGKIYGQDVILAETGYSSYRSSIISSYLIQKYEPYVLIYVGDCAKISENLRLGDVLMADYIQIVDVDELNRDPASRLYEVPGFPGYFKSSEYLVKLFNDSAAHVNVLNGRVGACLSGNKFVSDLKSLDFDTAAFEAAHRTELAFEGEVGGIALAAEFFKVPFLPLLSVSSDLNVKGSALERKRTILKDAIDIGKTVVSFIVAISNDENNFIRHDESEPKNRMKF